MAWLLLGVGSGVIGSLDHHQCRASLTEEECEQQLMIGIIVLDCDYSLYFPTIKGFWPIGVFCVHIVDNVPVHCEFLPPLQYFDLQTVHMSGVISPLFIRAMISET